MNFKLQCVDDSTLRLGRDILLRCWAAARCVQDITMSTGKGKIFRTRTVLCSVHDVMMYCTHLLGWYIYHQQLRSPRDSPPVPTSYEPCCSIYPDINVYPSSSSQHNAIEEIAGAVFGSPSLSLFRSSSDPLLLLIRSPSSPFVSRDVVF